MLQAVQEMPSGQAAPMIAFIAHRIPALAALPGSWPQAAFGQVLASCLTAIRVEVVSAPTLANAAATLLRTSLSPALRSVLLQLHSISSPGTVHISNHIAEAEEVAGASAAAQLPQNVAAADLNSNTQHAQQAPAAGGGGGQLEGVEGSEQVIACLLRLYHSAVGLYGECAATQLQIEPLLGQGTGLSTHQPSQQPATGQPFILGVWFQLEGMRKCMCIHITRIHVDTVCVMQRVMNPRGTNPKVMRYNVHANTPGLGSHWSYPNRPVLLTASVLQEPGTATLMACSHPTNSPPPRPCRPSPHSGLMRPTQPPTLSAPCLPSSACALCSASQPCMSSCCISSTPAPSSLLRMLPTPGQQPPQLLPVSRHQPPQLACQRLAFIAAQVWLLQLQLLCNFCCWYA